jgi:hypothetical protein
MTHPDAEALLAQGGWSLGDAQERHREHPDTFLLPDAAELDAIGPGSMIYLLFDVVDQADDARDGLSPWDVNGVQQLATFTERMWLFVERVDGDRIQGFLESMPTASHTMLEPGARLTVLRTDVLDTRPADLDKMAQCQAAFADMGWPVRDEPTLNDPVDRDRIRLTSELQLEMCERAEALPHLPYFMAGITVAKDLGAGAWPIYGMRTTPSAEHGQCGWFLWTGDPDMEAHDWEIVHVGDVRRIRPEAEAYLALPPGWGFVAGPDGADDIWFDEETL